MGPIDVAIIGGGIAGLATAYELHARGVAFQLFERSARLGGVILSEHVDGFTFDAGPGRAAHPEARGHRPVPRAGPWRPPLPHHRTAAGVHPSRRATLHPLPESSVLGIPRDVSALAATRLFSLPGKARMAAELFIPARRNGSGDESIASFIGRRFGREAVTYLAEPLLAGIHAGDVDRLSMRALFPRFLAGRAEVRQRAPGLPPAAAAQVLQRRVHVAARWPRRDRRGVGAGPAQARDLAERWGHSRKSWWDSPIRIHSRDPVRARARLGRVCRGEGGRRLRRPRTSLPTSFGRWTPVSPRCAPGSRTRRARQ